MGNIILRIIKLRNWLIFITVLDVLALFLSYLSPFFHPETNQWIPFFGLSYIIILGSTIIITLLWLFLKSRWIIIPIASILLGGKLHFRVFALGSDDTRKARTELKVTSYNVHLFDRYNVNFKESLNRRDAIFNYLKEIDSDVYCFQEFYQQDKPTRFATRDTMIGLLDIKDHHERFSHKYRKRQNFGVATFSKYPIITRGDIVFESTGSKFNFAIFTNIVKNNDTFRVYNVHLQSIRLGVDDYSVFTDFDPDANQMKFRSMQMISKIKNAYPIRANQVKKVAEHIHQSPYPVVLCGDFNDTPISYCYNQFNKILNDGFRQASIGIGATYVGKVPAGRIDYIFYDPSLGIRNFMIQNNPLSDHRAIHATIFTTD